MTNVEAYKKYTNQVDGLHNLMIGSTHSVSVTESLLVLPRVFVNSQMLWIMYIYRKKRAYCKQESETSKNRHYKTSYTYIAIEASAAQQCEE